MECRHVLLAILLLVILELTYGFYFPKYGRFPIYREYDFDRPDPYDPYDRFD
uniref:Prismin_1 n=1 Tax=Pinctada fucata TaxID=50426 RepID=A9EEL1_PINFU|nr:Prismin_1 [Pinctada fucata]